MPCNRRDCPHPGPHVHLPWRDRAAIANVLLELAAGRREGVMITARTTTRRAREQDHDDRTASAGPGG
jgi:hypothetical protein